MDQESSTIQSCIFIVSVYLIHTYNPIVPLLCISWLSSHFLQSWIKNPNQSKGIKKPQQSKVVLLLYQSIKYTLVPLLCINCCVLILCHIVGFCNNLFHSMQQANKPIQLLGLVVLWQLIGVWYQCPRQSWWILPNQIIPCTYTNTITNTNTYCWILSQYHRLGCWNTIIHYLVNETGR